MLTKRLISLFIFTMLLIPIIVGASVADGQASNTGLVHIKMIGQSKEPGQVISPDSHFAAYVPPCQYPFALTAFAAYTTGPGLHTIQFAGNKIWSGQGYCGYSSCTWMSYAELSSAGDIVWVYSVNAPISADVSHWCSNGIPAIVEH